MAERVNQPPRNNRPSRGILATYVVKLRAMAAQLLREAQRFSGEGLEDTIGGWSATASLGRIRASPTAWAQFERGSPKDDFPLGRPQLRPRQGGGLDCQVNCHPDRRRRRISATMCGSGGAGSNPNNDNSSHRHHRRRQPKSCSSHRSSSSSHHRYRQHPHLRFSQPNQSWSGRSRIWIKRTRRTPTTRANRAKYGCRVSRTWGGGYVAVVTALTAAAYSRPR